MLPASLKSRFKYQSIFFAGEQSGITSIGLAVAVSGASIIGLTVYQQRSSQQIAEISADVKKTSAVSENLAAIKRLESLMKNRRKALDFKNKDSLPVMYPKPYTSKRVTIQPTRAYTADMPWQTKGKKIIIPSLSRGASVKELYANDTQPFFSKQNNVTIKSLSAIYDESGFIIKKFEVEATSVKKLKNGTDRAFTTRALVDVPEPPEPRCEILLNVPPSLSSTEVYRPRSQVESRVRIWGLATHLEVVDGSFAIAGSNSGEGPRKITGLLDDVFSSSVISYSFATPSPLPVLDGDTTAEYTHEVRVKGVNGSVATCSQVYTLARPPTCGILADNPVLPPGASTGFIRRVNIGGPDSALQNFRAVRKSKSGKAIPPEIALPNEVFTMPMNVSSGTTFSVFADVTSDAGTETCLADVVAVTSLGSAGAGGVGDPNSPGGGDVTPNPGGGNGGGNGGGGMEPPGDKGDGGGVVTKPPKNVDKLAYCPAIFPGFDLGKIGAKGYKIGSWGDTKLFQVEVIARTPKDTRICPATSRCYAVWKGKERNRFLEIMNINKKTCTAKLIDRVNLGCFAAGSKIRMADGSLKAAEFVVEGDSLFNPVSKKPAKVVRTTSGPEALPFVVIHTGGKTLKVTTDHPIVTRGGLKEAELIIPGDEILSSEGAYLKVADVDSMPSNRVLVFNFEVEADSGSVDMNDHMIEADGIVTGDLFVQEELARKTEAERRRFVRKNSHQ